MALARKTIDDFTATYAPSQRDQFEVISEDEIDADDDLNVIVAKKMIDDQAKEAGRHTVEPLLNSSGNEETKEETKEAPLDKPRLIKQSSNVSMQMLKRAKKARDKSLKDILAFEGRYNLKFLS